MQSTDELDRVVREEARWLMLRTLYMARPIGTTDSIILRGLLGVPLHVTINNVRNELDYLAGKGLITLDTKKKNSWHAKLLAYGIDVVEGAKDAPAGIARPDDH